MLIHEKIAVAAIVLAALIYLIRATVAKYRAKRTESACAGCGCGRAVQLAGRTAQDARHP